MDQFCQTKHVRTNTLTPYSVHLNYKSIAPLLTNLFPDLLPRLSKIAQIRQWEIPSPSISATTTAVLVKRSLQALTYGSYPTSISVGTPSHHYLVERTLHLCTQIPFLAPATVFATENTTGSSIIHGISAFQVCRIHLQTFLQYFPRPWVSPICSGISRYRESGPAFPTFEISASPFLHQGLAQPGHKDSVEQLLACTTTYQKLSVIASLLPGTVGAPSYPLLAQAGITETHPAMPIIHGISAFQVRRIHLSTSLQYSPTPWVHPICSGISRYRESGPNSPNLEKFRRPFSV